MAAIAIAVTLATTRCSLFVDTSGLSGGGSSNGDGAAPEGGGPDAAAESGSDGAPGGGATFGGPWLAYGTAAGVVSVRTWNAPASSWSPPIPGPSLGASVVRWVVAKETPLGAYLGVVSLGAASASLQVFERSASGAWVPAFEAVPSQPAFRGFDIEYETQSKAVMVVYADGTPQLKYRRRTAAGWSPVAEIEPSGGAIPHWVELERNPLFDEITLAYDDTGSNLKTVRWNGTAWSPVQFLEGAINVGDFKAFDLAYENVSDNLLAVWGRDLRAGGPGPGDMRWSRRLLGSDSFPPATSELDGAPPGPIELAPEPGSPRIALAYLEYNCQRSAAPCDNLLVGMWGGSGWTSLVTSDNDITTPYSVRAGTRPVGVAWAGGAGGGVAAYHRDLADPGQLPFVRFTSSSVGSVVGATFSPPLAARASVALATGPGNVVLAAVADTSGALYGKTYRDDSGGTWSNADDGLPLATGLAATVGVPFSVASVGGR